MLCKYKRKTSRTIKVFSFVFDGPYVHVIKLVHKITSIFILISNFIINLAVSTWIHATIFAELYNIRKYFALVHDFARNLFSLLSLWKTITKYYAYVLRYITLGSNFKEKRPIARYSSPHLIVSAQSIQRLWSISTFLRVREREKSLQNVYLYYKLYRDAVNVSFQYSISI